MMIQMTSVMGYIGSLSRAGWRLVIIAVLAGVHGLHSVQAEERANFFNDPFLQVTSGIQNCPIPRGPEITRAEMQAQAHVRSERGTNCYLSGRCRLPNSYLYDQEIIARVKKAIEADGRFAQTSIWALGQRRWVSLRGCVRRSEEARAVQQLVRAIDDVEAVIDELIVKK